MKANQRLRSRDEAVSNALGGILFFSLAFLFLLLVRVDFVPVWEEEREAAQMERVAGQFVSLKSAVDRQAANRTSVELTHALTLSSTSAARFFSPSDLPGTVTFTAGASGASVTTSQIRVLAESGRSVAAIDEEWLAIDGPVTLGSVEDVKHLRLRLMAPWNEQEGDRITVAVTDSDGQAAGSLEVYLHKDPPEFFLNNRVTGPAGNIMYDQGDAFHRASAMEYWWVDALADPLHFSDVLHAASAPFTLTLAESGMQAEYAITYLQDTGNGGFLIGSSGVLLPQFDASLAGGVLHMDSAVDRFVDQDLFFENGAVIVAQPEGAAMRIPPDFRLTAGNGLTRVALTVPALVGASDSVSQRGTVSLATDTAAAWQFEGTAPHLNYTVATRFPTVWAGFFLRAAQDGGLGSDQYEVSSSPDAATIRIWGPDAAADSTAHDLSVDLSYANVRLAIKS